MLVSKTLFSNCFGKLLNGTLGPDGRQLALRLGSGFESRLIGSPFSFERRVEVVLQVFPLLGADQKRGARQHVDEEDQPGQQVRVPVVDPRVLQYPGVEVVKGELQQCIKILGPIL